MVYPYEVFPIESSVSSCIEWCYIYSNYPSHLRIMIDPQLHHPCSRGEIHCLSTNEKQNQEFRIDAN